MSNAEILVGVVGLVVVGALITFNVLVTSKVWRSSVYTKSQKRAQSAVVWLLPFAGLWLVWGVLREESIQHFIEPSEKVEVRELAGLYESANPLGPAAHDFDVGHQ